MYCCRQLNICFGLSNPESDCSDYLPPGPDSLPTITSDFYLVPILYHASQFSNHCFGQDVNLAPINRNLVTAYRLHVSYFDSVFLILERRCALGNVNSEIFRWVLRGYVVLLAHTKYVFSSLLSFPMHSSLRVYRIPFFSRALRETYQIGATSRFCLPH